jgi:Protein of unknown function (DUF4231)
MPYFWELDDEAQSAQNQFRREQVILILGTACATILGAIQAARPGKLPGIIEAVLAASLAAIILRSQTLKTHKAYFANRLKAESLRGEYFLFLRRSEPYTNDGNRVSKLIERVAGIRAEETNYE